MLLRFKPTPRELKSTLLYVIDWIFVGGTVLAAFAFSDITPNLRPFSIQDQSIAFPYQHNAKIPTRLLATFSTIIPGILIALLVFGLPNHRRKGLKQRIWLLNSAWLGLGVSLAAAMLVTDGLKNLVGKPRPDLLSRCDPDSERISSGEYDIGNTGYLYSAAICKTYIGTSTSGLNKDDLFDGFRSWVSGHASLSFAGLTYLSIFSWYYILQYLYKPLLLNSTVGTSHSSQKSPINHPSAPLLLILSVPLLLATYIASTRFSDYRHHGVDIILGSALGIATAILGWRWYGSRTINKLHESGGFSAFGRRCRKCGDVEMGRVQEGNANTSELFLTNSGADLRRFSGSGNEVRETSGDQGPGNNPQREPKGALQLREINLSISTFDTPEQASQGKAGSAHQHGGEPSQGIQERGFHGSHERAE